MVEEIKPPKILFRDNLSLPKKYSYLPSDPDKKSVEHNIPFGDKTLCVLVMKDYTIVTGVIKDLETYEVFKGETSDYQPISDDQKSEAKQAVITYFDNRLADNRPAFDSITKNIQFW